MATTPPGWYDDGRGALRWWDGAQWTEHVQTPDPEPEAPAQAPAEAMDALLAPTIAPPFPPAPTLESARAADAGPAAPAQPGGYANAGEYYPSAPQGYPGGFPGGPAPSGAFISATEPKKSKLWVLWVVLGVVLLGIAILAAVLIPIVIGLFGSVANSGSEGDEAAAVAVVELYDEAWRTVDCAKFEDATTEDFRVVLELPDCESFTIAAQGFSDSVDDYEITVVSVESADDAFTVETRENFTSMFDEEDNPTDEPVAYEQLWTYTVVATEGGLAIGDAVLE